jgi:hypothetical protein
MQEIKNEEKSWMFFQQEKKNNYGNFFPFRQKWIFNLKQKLLAAF